MAEGAELLVVRWVTVNDWIETESIDGLDWGLGGTHPIEDCHDLGLRRVDNKVPESAEHEDNILWRA